MLDKNTILDKDWIAAHIPHQGSMCLLDQVTDWSEQQITCIATSHQLADNPLRYQAQLSTACGIEYAAQAMATHGAILANQQDRPRAGFLVSVRGAHIHRTRLDDIKQPLTINAMCIHSSEDNILYSFSLYADDAILLDGRATVMLNAETVLGVSK